MIPYHYDRHLSNIHETFQVSTIHMMHAFWGNYDKYFKYLYAIHFDMYQVCAMYLTIPIIFAHILSIHNTFYALI